MLLYINKTNKLKLKIISFYLSNSKLDQIIGFWVIFGGLELPYF